MTTSLIKNHRIPAGGFLCLMIALVSLLTGGKGSVLLRLYCILKRYQTYCASPCTGDGGLPGLIYICYAFCKVGGFSHYGIFLQVLHACKCYMDSAVIHTNKKAGLRKTRKPAFLAIGATGFEPATSATPMQHSTKLSHAPTSNIYTTIFPKNCQGFQVISSSNLCLFQPSNESLAWQKKSWP